MPGPAAAAPIRVFGAQASPWQMTSWSAGGIAAALSSAAATVSP